MKIKLDRETLDAISDEALRLSELDKPDDEHESQWMVLSNTANTLSIIQQVAEYKQEDV